MAGGEANGIRARVDNLEDWVRRNDGKLSDFLENKPCDTHEKMIETCDERSEKAVIVAERAEKTMKRLLIGAVLTGASILIGLVIVILQTAPKG